MRATLFICQDGVPVRKVWLQPGDRRVVGRTDASDVSIPHDRFLSAVHFEVCCLDQFVSVRDLESSCGTWINGERRQESRVATGDFVIAGETTFQFVVETCQCPQHDVVVPLNVYHQETTTEAEPHTSILCDAPPPSLESLNLTDEALGLLDERHPAPPEFVEQLVASKRWADAVQVCAHLIQKSQAVLWGVSSIRRAAEDRLTDLERQALQTVERWALEPTEPARRQAGELAAKLPNDSPTHWIASAVFESGGSVGPKDGAAISPPREATSQSTATAIEFAVYQRPAGEEESWFELFLKTGYELMSDFSRA